MMKFIPLPFVFFLIVNVLSAQKGEFFYKSIACEQGRVLCLDQDGFLWVGCHQNKQPLLLKMTQGGVLLETVRLNSAAGSNNLLTDLKMDSEGMIVGCGTSDPISGADTESSFVFRYNPRTQTMLWSRKVSDNYHFANGIVEKGAGGDFLIYGSKLTNVSSITSVLQLDRTTGDIDTSFSKNYSLGASEDFAAGLYHKGHFYTVGKNDQSYLYTITVERYLRQSLCKFDSVGKPIWTLLGSAPIDKMSFLRGRDMVIDRDSIVSIASGDDDNFNKTNAYVFLQKTTLDGQLVWMKKFDVPGRLERAQDIVSVPDGYIILCHGTAGNSNAFYFKTDKNGNFLWGQSITSDAQPNEYLNKPQSRLLASENGLFFLLNDGTNKTVLLKTDFNGNLPNCDRIKSLNVITLPLAKITMQRNISLISEKAQGLSQPVAATTPVPPLVGIENLCKSVDAEPFDACKPITFLREMETPNAAKNWLSSICNNRDGFLYAAGQTDGQAGISKINPDGKVLWSRKLLPESSETLKITELIADSDSLLVGCGRMGNQVLAFRYNPQKNALLWANTFAGDLLEGGGVLEKGAGGNFVFYHNHRPDTEPAHAGIIELERATGKQVVGIARRYKRPDEMSINAISLQDNNLYAIGDAVAGPLANERSLVQKLDRSFGAVLWTKLGPTDSTAAGRFLGQDIVSDAAGVVALSIGNETSNETNAPKSVFLQKLSLNGDAVWVKKYDIALNEADLEQISGGYLITGKTAFGKLAILKTDLNGNLLISKILDYSAAAAGTSFGRSRSHVLQMGNYLLFAHYLSKNNFEKIVLLKTDLNLDIAEGCNLLKALNVNSSNLNAPKALQTKVADPFLPNATTAIFKGNFAANTLKSNQLCPAPLNIPTLQLGDNTLLKCPEAKDTLTAQNGFQQYKWQDGSTNPELIFTQAGLYWVETTDQCGEKQRDSVVVTALSNPKDTQDVFFYPGNFVKINGVDYGDEGQVTAVKKNPSGCDSIITYNLKYIIAKLDATCPANLTVTLPPNANSMVVNYASPSVKNECPTSGILYKLLKGKPSGGTFTLGITEVCYEASNRCGIKDTCCFRVTVQGLEPACETKTNGSCLKFELVSIRFDAQNQRRYRYRITNTCASPLNFVAMQLPNGIAAATPVQGSAYTGSSGRSYDVRNPSTTPYHSIRFKTQAVGFGIANGDYETFEYTLPQQSAPGFVRVMARLEDGSGGEVQFATSGCPVQPFNGNKERENGDDAALFSKDAPLLYPNPSTGEFWLNLSAWQGQKAQIQVLNVLGEVVLTGKYVIENEQLALQMPRACAQGLYVVRVQMENGERISLNVILAQE